jgi:predicted Holliday junction resolvase-like endonuclease
MTTELNKNRKWSSREDFTKRSKKITEESVKNSIKSVIGLMTAAIKAKHL